MRIYITILLLLTGFICHGQAQTIANPQIRAAAAIDVTKLANGLVSNTEFQYLDGVTSAIQTQLADKASITGSYSNPTWITALAWGKVTGTPTTLAGYGITDAVINTRTVNGHALSSNVTVTADDVLPTQTGNNGKFLTTNGTTASWGTPAGSGTVTSVSVTTANGVSGSVATATTTPAITLTLGVIAPTSVNGLTISTTTGTLTIASGKTATVSNTLTLAGTDGKGIDVGAATSGKFLVGNGTNMVLSTSTIPTDAGATAGKVVLSDGTNYALSTPTFPNASATSGKIIKSDGTNWIASTETYAAPGTSGNVLTSDGTNWTSAAPAGGNPVLFVQTADASTTTTSEVNVIGTGNGSLTLAIGKTNHIGDVVEIYSSGFIVIPASPSGTLTFKVKYGSTVLASAVSSIAGGEFRASNTCSYTVMVTVTTRTTGTSGTVMCSGYVLYPSSSTSDNTYALAGKLSNGGTASTVNLSGATQAITVTAQFSTSQATKVVTGNNGTVKYYATP